MKINIIIINIIIKWEIQIQVINPVVAMKEMEVLMEINQLKMLSINSKFKESSRDKLVQAISQSRRLLK